MSRPILIDIQDQVALLTLNRPENRNVISSAEMIDALVNVVDELNANSNIGAAVLTGAGRAFSAGGDVKKMLEDGGPDGRGAQRLMHDYEYGIQRIPRAFERLEVPLIAAVNGPAIGAGGDLVSMCDIRIASTRAKYGATFVNIGLIPGDGGAYLLQRIIGYAKAMELVLTGRVIDADEGLAIGYYSQVVEEDALIDTALEMARNIAAKPRLATRLAKKLVQDSSRSDLDMALRLASSFQSLVQSDPDHISAVEALLAQQVGKKNALNNG